MAKVALLVGVSEYEPGLNPLPGSVQDVDAMQRVLAHPELGGFAETDITVLKNPQRQAMEDAIYWLFNDRKKDDLLLFYFSGHGIKDENGRLYLATRATRKDSNGRLVKPSAVAAASLHENINESRSQRQVMILDCCFSGAIAQGMTVKDDGTVNLKDYLGGKGRAILTSSTSTEYSFGAETVGHDNAGLSIYTRYLVEGIEKGAADTDGDGWIAVEELHEYAANRVKEAAPAMTPKFYPVEEGYKIVLARSRKDDPKLKYRKEAQTWAERGQGQFSIIAKRILEGKQIEWAISANEAKAIEDEVLQPYREYEGKQQEYEQTLAKIVQSGYPLSATTEAELKEYQQYLGLRDADIADIEERIFSPLRTEYAHQQQEAERLKQAQEQVDYKSKYQIKPELELQEHNEILDLDQLLSQQGEQENNEILDLDQLLSQQGEQEQKTDYQQKLRRYQQKLHQLSQKEYPLGASAIEKLKRSQLSYGIKDDDANHLLQELEQQRGLRETSQQPQTSTNNLEGLIDKSYGLLSAEGIDYSHLERLLKAKKWKRADDTTRELIKKLAEPIGLDDQGISKLSCIDLRTIDSLWVKYSNGHFGFSVQRRIYEHYSKNTGRWMETIGWRNKPGVFMGMFNTKSREQLTFDLTAEEGHLPTGSGGMMKDIGWNGWEKQFFGRLEKCGL